METDPVCGMQVDKEQATGKSEHSGKTYYFCSPVSSAGVCGKVRKQDGLLLWGWLRGHPGSSNEV